MESENGSAEEVGAKHRILDDSADGAGANIRQARNACWPVACAGLAWCQGRRKRPTRPDRSERGEGQHETAAARRKPHNAVPAIWPCS